MKNKNQLVVGKGYRNQRLYVLAVHATQLRQERTNYVSTTRPTWDQWHRRYGHISIAVLQQLKKEGLVSGLTINQSFIPSKMCKACIQAKQSHKPFPQEAKNRSKVPGERVLTDVWGPARVESIGGWKYYISFNDNSIRYRATLFTKTKGDAPQRIKEHTAKVKQHFRKGLTYLRVNNSKELVNADVKRFCAEEGITIETTAPYSPFQNGIAERYNHTLLELV